MRCEIRGECLETKTSESYWHDKLKKRYVDIDTIEDLLRIIKDCRCDVIVDEDGEILLYNTWME